MIYKRLQRAKEKLRTEQIRIQSPAAVDIDDRLPSVLMTLYLLFNEGYYSAASDVTIRKELCIEAMRLTYLLTDHQSTRKPEVFALLSLMCFHASRFEARLNDQGETVLYHEQDRDRWNHELITKGNIS